MDGSDQASSQQDERYVRAAETLGPALERLARAFEADPDQQKDLLQEIHFAVWRSFSRFDGRCSESTWVYRVAHNAAASHVASRKRLRAGGMLTLDELERIPDPAQPDRRPRPGSAWPWPGSWPWCAPSACLIARWCCCISKASTPPPSARSAASSPTLSP